MRTKLAHAKSVESSEHRPCRHHGHGRHCGHDRRHDHVKPRCCLAEVPCGKSAVIAGLECNEGFRGKMMAMGLIPGATATVVRGGGKQPMLLTLPHGRFVLDHDSARRIVVHGAVA